MKALDLFCGAGGASMGLYNAGFDVIGVDIQPQANYPFEFVEANAMMFPLDGYDLIWTSPPCQAFTAYRRRHAHVGDYPNLIGAVRTRLRVGGTPYVIENVLGSPLERVSQLCGSSFGLDIRRHRLFETSFPVLTPSCNHGWRARRRFAPATNRKNKRDTVEIGVWRIPLDVQQRAMEIDWMTREELSQAIPPAYSKFLANQL